MSLNQTTLEIVHVSYKLPFIVMFNPENHQVIFGLVKKRVNGNDGLLPLSSDDIMEDNLAYIRGIEPDSRHPELFNISRESKLYIDEVFTIGSQYSPTKVHLAKGLSNSFELNVYLFN